MKYFFILLLFLLSCNHSANKSRITAKVLEVKARLPGKEFAFGDIYFGIYIQLENTSNKEISLRLTNPCKESKCTMYITNERTKVKLNLVSRNCNDIIIKPNESVYHLFFADENDINKLYHCSNNATSILKSLKTNCTIEYIPCDTSARDSKDFKEGFVVKFRK